MLKIIASVGFILGSLAFSAQAQDIEGAIEHPMIERYPGQVLAWQHIENYQPYKVPFGPVTGYRHIEDVIETEGRLTRTFYKYQGTDRTFSEIYRNYLEALETEGFEIIGRGMSPDRRGADVGTRSWTEVYFILNPLSRGGEANSMMAGTATSGGAGAIVARKERAAGTAYVIVHVEQHAEDYIGTLVDIVEVETAETGLVSVDAEAIGNDIEEFGRVVLTGIVFEFDSDRLLDESAPTLAEIARFLNDNPEKSFFVVGHTDSVGSFGYNRELSMSRANAVVEALIASHGIVRERLQPHGVGPLVPVFSNETESGRDANRRVELVEIID